MSLAVKAGLPGSESAEWARVTLGDLCLATGKLAEATTMYQNALTARPNFPNAEIGLAKVAKAQQKYPEAIAHTEAAIRIASEAAYISFLGELYELKGDKTKAIEIKTDVIKLLNEAEQAPNIGRNSDATQCK